MSELRDRIAAIIDEIADCDVDYAREYADKILALPEIKMALAYRPRQAGYRNIVTKDGGSEFVETARDSGRLPEGENSEAG